VHRSFEITSETIPVANAFGGAIFIDLGGTNGFDDTPPNFGTEKIVISNAIEHPLFVLGLHSDVEWNKDLKYKPGPYAVFVCDNLILVQKASRSRALSKPTELMTWWNDVVALQDGLSGRLNPRTSPELINVDVQIEYGAAHAGYPIQAWERYWTNLADYDNLLVEGSWGDFHELGHNLQRNWWTVSYDVEVTVNIFSAYCLRRTSPTSTDYWNWTLDPIQVMQKSIAALKGGKPYASISDLAQRLAFWMQLIDGFGFDSLSNVFQSYEEDALVNSSLLPLTELERWSQFLERMSVESGHDLTEFMVLTWGLEVSPSVIDAVRHLPSWMPAIVRTYELAWRISVHVLNLVNDCNYREVYQRGWRRLKTALCGWTTCHELPCPWTVSPQLPM
jgi:hypothetical protein